MGRFVTKKRLGTFLPFHADSSDETRDYATWSHLQKNITSTAPLCDYKMVSASRRKLTMAYFSRLIRTITFPSSWSDISFRTRTALLENPTFLRLFFHTRNKIMTDRYRTLGSVLPENSNLTYKELAQINAKKIVTLAAPFAAPGNQTKENLMHLKDGEIVGEWRDSTYGIGGGRIPFDVNTALVPAALRSIASLSSAGTLEFNATMISEYAQVSLGEIL